MRKWYLPALLMTLAACSPTEESSGNLSLEDMRGQWVVINYWAIWCKPCIQEIPELNALDELPTVTVLGVNFDNTSGEQLQQQVEKLGIAFPILGKDPASELGVPRPVVLPTTLVLDPKGQLRGTLVGPQTLETLTAATSGGLEETP